MTILKINIRQRSIVIVNDVGPSEAAVCAGRTHLGRSFMIHVYMSNGRKVLKNKRVYELFQCYRVRDDKIWQIIYHICDGAVGLGFRSSVIIRYCFVLRFPKTSIFINMVYYWVDLC